MFEIQLKEATRQNPSNIVFSIGFYVTQIFRTP